MRIALALGALGLVLTIQSVSATRKDVVEGNPASPVKVLIYEDLQCGDCARFETLLDQKILPKYGSRVAFVHRDFPLAKHDWALPAAIAARWVYEQDPQLGIIFRRELLSEQDDITPRNLRNWLFEFAGRNRLDQKDIVDSLKDPRLAALVDQDRLAGAARGITNTPTVCVGSQMFVETIIYEDLARALDEALAK
jgi:protein-disulfide isomerase